MIGRERVLRATSFKQTDRVPKDLGGMASTGISCFAYPRLVKALGLPPRLPRVHDTAQMLALPDTDVLDALGCDVVTVFWNCTNAYEEPRKWRRFDFGGRLDARVRSPRSFRVLPGGVIEQPKWKIKMPPSAVVFNADHAGQNLDIMDEDEMPLKDLKKLREKLARQLPKPEEITRIRELCDRVRHSTDRAVFYNGPGVSEIAISGHGGMAVFPMICLLHPDYVMEYHEIMTRQVVTKLEMVLPEIRDFVDVILLGGDDWGTQCDTIASPKIFNDLFAPFYKQMNETAHRLAPNTKTFMHSCGAIFNILDGMIESGFDILNPVQWTAGGRSFREWKNKCHGRIALWGGGVNTQQTLPLGRVEDVEREVREIVACLSDGGGYVFNAIHNLLAEVTPEKVIAMYRAADEAGSPVTRCQIMKERRSEQQ